MLLTTGIPISLTGAMMSPDEIEQRIIRAYVQLAFAPETNDPHTVTVAQVGVLEARLTEIPEEQRTPGMPWFWLEIYCHARRSVVGNCGCTEFDELELAQAVELIASAGQQRRDLH